MDLPDPNDRHVVAVAIASKSPIIVTFNLSDFPSDTLRALGIEAIHPDDFAVRLYEDSTDVFVAAVTRHRSKLRKPSKTVDEYLTTLLDCGLQKTADRLRVHADVI